MLTSLILEINKRVAKCERVLVTTLTKKMSEELTSYLESKGIKVRYMHSDIEALDRLEIIRDLRLGKYDCVVGINLLREGIDIPEVSLIAILDADKEGFLRSSRSLIQTIGRCARNENGKCIMYADKVTDSMDYAIKETMRRRAIQEEYNLVHDIVPRTIIKEIRDLISNVDDNHDKKVKVTKKEQIRNIEDEETLILKLQKQYRNGEIKEEELSEEQVKSLCDLYDKQIANLRKSNEMRKQKLLEYRRKLQTDN